MHQIEPEEFRLWRAFLAAQAAVVSGIESDLGALTNVSLSDLEVLTALDDNGGQMRMAELADAANASRSGLTRRVDRLKSQGLVDRASVPSDRRGSYAVITDAGLRHLEGVLPTYQSVVRRRFLSVFSDDERAMLLQHLERLTDVSAFQPESVSASRPSR
ncbi:MAG: MarR family transcriptional regulator [Acidimicrobiia bacterium]|nr:MarR family transcriptional regulator [Acidimicrobiia bacterium]